jgi:uncharacterized membrane protein
VTHQFIRRLFRQELALTSSVLVALSPLHISYSQEARPTVLLVLFSMLSFGALLDGLKTERRGNWVRFTVYSMLNVWSSYFAIVLVLPTVGAVTLLHIIRAWRNGEPEAGKTIV